MCAGVDRVWDRVCAGVSDLVCDGCGTGQWPVEARPLAWATLLEIASRDRVWDRVCAGVSDLVCDGCGTGQWPVEARPLAWATLLG